jgi:exopolysaccharide biosynthesis protein
MAKRQQKHAAKKSLFPARLGNVFKWIGLGLGGVVAVVVIGFLTMFYTPFFPEARTQYILMTLHTSNPWLATVFFSEETINAVVEANKVVEPEGNTNTDLIQVGNTTTTGATTQNTTINNTTTAATTVTTGTTSVGTTVARPSTYKDKATVIHQGDGFDVLQIVTDKYTARLIRVKDPSRVQLGLCKDFMQSGKRGEKLPDMVNRLGAVAGINAGGFQDKGGVGSGNYPTQLCVKDGEILYADPALSTYQVIGFNKDNVLVLGKYTKQQILDNNIRDAIAFRPYLILNGKKAAAFGAAGGRDPRAAVGQTADGTVLLLACDGRQANMEGANMQDLTDIMWEFGAVNAANIDGGSSTTVVIEGQLINKPCGPAGARYLPNGWLVF